MVKFPLPLHPGMPVRVQVPAMVLLLTVPCRVSTLLVAPGNNVEMVMVNVPVTLPLELLLRLNVPVSEVALVKHDPLVVNVKLVMVIVPPLSSVKSPVKAKAGELSALVRLAVQVPLMVPGFELLLPHPVVASPSKKKTIIPNDLFTISILVR